MVLGTPSSSLIGYGLEWGWDVRFVSLLSWLHNVDRNATWCRQRCCGGGTRPCHLLMVKTMVKSDLALQEHRSFRHWRREVANRFLSTIQQELLL